MEFAQKLAHTSPNSWENTPVEPSYIEPKSTQAPYENLNTAAKKVGKNIHEAANRYEQQKTQGNQTYTKDQDNSFAANQNVKEENWDLSPKTKSIAEKLGFMNFEDDQFDKPSFMRKEKGVDQLP